MISIKQIHQAVARKDFEKANSLADDYLKYQRIPASIKLYLDIASWRTQNLEKDNESLSQDRLCLPRSSLYVIAGPFSTKEELEYGLERLSFYIAPFATEITLISDHILPNELQLNNDIDPLVSSTYKDRKKALIFKRTAKPFSKLLSEHNSNEHLVILDFSHKRQLLSELKQHSSLPYAKGYGVAASSRNEGSLFIQSVYDFLCSSNTINLRTRKNEASRFRRFIGSNKGEEISLVCNGPSIADLSRTNPLSKRTKAIMCNTVFINEEINLYFEAICIVFADPIFHFGISSYAAEFRNNVIRKVGVKGYNPTVIIPEKYAHILYHYMPSIVPYSISIPHQKIDSFNTDLESYFVTKTTPNILTFLMMPIGATLAKTMYLFGVDGRPRNENSYFWSHDKKSQLSDEKMKNIQSVHTSFFAIDYNNYYDEHIDICKSFCSQLEKSGHTLYCCTKTHIDPFKLRTHPRLLSEPVYKSKTVFVSLNPDACKNEGHYLSHERMLSHVIKERDSSHIVLCNSVATSSTYGNFSLIPTFSCEGSWLYKLDRLKRDFQNELFFSIAEVFSLVSKDCQVIIYMYMGSTRVAAWISELLALIPSEFLARLHVYINCFYNIVDPKPEQIRSELEYIECSPHKGGIHLSIDTEHARQLLLECSGFDFNINIWPMIATTDYSHIFGGSHNDKIHSISLPQQLGNRKYAVYFPATSQRAKGVDIALQLCLKLSYENPDKCYAIRKSNHRIDASIEAAFQEAGARSNIHIIDSVASDIDYLKTFLDSEVSCITYDPSFFKAKTSAVLLDSVACGCKVVCCQSTWLAQELTSSQFNAYALSSSHSASSYYTAVQEVESLYQADEKAVTHFLCRYSATALHDYMISKAALS